MTESYLKISRVHLSASLASQSQRICQEEGREDEPGDKDAWYRAGHFQRTEQTALEAEGVVSMLEKGCEVALNP